jgi:hypothetical protein
VDHSTDPRRVDSARVEHEIFMSGEVRMRSLFIDAELSPANLQQCCVLAVTPLLRELIVRAVQGPQHAENPLIQQLMLQELASLENLHIPMPERSALAEHLSGTAAKT